MAGEQYRVLKDYAYFGSTFTAGSTVEFDSAAYERYDSTSLFRFYPAARSPADKNPLIWDLHDDEPATKITEYFAALEHEE